MASIGYDDTFQKETPRRIGLGPSSTQEQARHSLWYWLRQVPVHVGLILWGLTCVFPLVWIVLSSLKSTPELYRDPFGIPQAWKWTNYRDAWVYAKMGSYFLNSVFITILSTIVVLFLSSTFAFVLARFDFKAKGPIWAYVLFGFLIPHSMLLVPLAIFTRTLGLYNRLEGLALVYAAVVSHGTPFF